MNEVETVDVVELVERVERVETVEGVSISIIISALSWANSIHLCISLFLHRNYHNFITMAFSEKLSC